MKRIILVLLLLSSCSTFIFSQIYVDDQGNVYNQNTNTRATSAQKRATKQPTKSSFDPSKLEFGGNLGLQFGNYTVVNISPQVGYRFTNYLSAGAGLGYTYYSDDRGNYDYKEHFLGFNLYANLYPTSFLIFSVRPEINRMWMTQKVHGEKYSEEKFVPSVVVGGGFRFMSITAQVKYDVVQDKYSPYGNRLFYSLGFSF